METFARGAARAAGGWVRFEAVPRDVRFFVAFLLLRAVFSFFLLQGLF